MPQGVEIPEYPYGESRFYKQSNLGLYGSQKIRYGNIVSKKNEIKTRRHWRPNVQHKRLWSGYLGQSIRIRITTGVMRTIEKCGGLDEYLLGEKASRIKDLGVFGWALRWRIMQTDGVKERYRLERERLGLPPKQDDVLAQLQSPEELQAQVQEFDDQLAKGEEMALEDGLAEDDVGVAEPQFMREEQARL